MRSLLKSICLVLGLAFSSLSTLYGGSLASLAKVKVPTQAETLDALNGLATLGGFEADETLLATVADFYDLPQGDALDKATREDLLEVKNVALWSGSIEEFIGLVAVIFEDAPASAQAQKQFDRYREVLERFEAAINDYVLSIHPGLEFLGISKLSAIADGQGVTIAVFDVFDLEALALQRKAFPQAQIDAPVTFNKPLSLSHGNTVIDVILRIAPAAHIIPVWADAKDYDRALQYIVDHPAIDIVNMSRAFAEGSDHMHLEPAFKKTLKTLVQSRILSKALGNSGTDLLGHVTAKRVAEGLGPVHNLSSYDINLVADTYSDANEEDLLVFALNLSLFADDIALSASIPGDIVAIQERTLGVPAEGVWSPSTKAFESGSSFAAPQLSALSALLLQKERAKGGSLIDQRKAALEALKGSAQLQDHKASDWGLGLPAGDTAAGL